MKALLATIALGIVSAAIAAPFSPEEILGTYTSSDRKAVVKIYKEIVKERTLFDPAEYKYYADFKVDGGPCMNMYGDDRQIIAKKEEISYNGNALPRFEYLSASYVEDSDYDGDVFVDDLRFTATRINAPKKVQLSLELSLGHNPDGGDGEDGGVAKFDRCWKKTVSSWKTFTKTK